MLTSVFVFLLILLIIIVLLLIAILFFEGEIVLLYKYRTNINDLHFIFKIGKLVLKKHEINFNKPMVKKKKINRSKNISKYIIQALKSNNVTSEFNIKIIEGTGDAAHTAVIYGVFYILAGFIKVIFENNTNLIKENIEIICDFNKEFFSADISCIFRLKLVNIISESFKIYRNRKIMKR